MKLHKFGNLKPDLIRCPHIREKWPSLPNNLFSRGKESSPLLDLAEIIFMSLPLVAPAMKFESAVPLSRTNIMNIFSPRMPMGFSNEVGCLFVCGAIYLHLF